VARVVLSVLLLVLAGAIAPPSRADAAAGELSRAQVRIACRSVPAGAARWAHAVNRYWGRWLARYQHRRLTVSELRRALLIIWRESNGQPRVVNHSSGCAGLFQLLPAYGRGRYNLLQPQTNISLAGMLYVRRGWAPWAL